MHAFLWGNNPKLPPIFHTAQLLNLKAIIFCNLSTWNNGRRNFLANTANQIHKNTLLSIVFSPRSKQNANYLCRVMFKEPVQPLILFWASRWVIPCALIPSMLRTTSPILTFAWDALPPSLSCNKYISLGVSLFKT